MRTLRLHRNIPRPPDASHLMVTAVWGHTGGFPGIMTVVNMYPQTGDVMVVQSNQPNPTARKVWQAVEKLMSGPPGV